MNVVQILLEIAVGLVFSVSLTDLHIPVIRWYNFDNYYSSA